MTPELITEDGVSAGVSDGVSDGVSADTVFAQQPARRVSSGASPNVLATNRNSSALGSRVAVQAVQYVTRDGGVRAARARREYGGMPLPQEGAPVQLTATDSVTVTELPAPTAPARQRKTITAAPRPRPIYTPAPPVHMHQSSQPRGRRGVVFPRMIGMALIGAMLHPAVVCAQRRVAAPLVLDGVTVIDVRNGDRVAEQRVVIAGNHIRAVGRAGAVRVPAGARVVDAHGKYLIPGLWDMHVHADTLTDTFYPLLVANGVTGIRDAASSVPLATLRRWRREILAGTRVGPPRQLLSGPALDDAVRCREDSVRYRNMPPTHICITDPVRVVDSLKAAGADIIKAYNLTRESYLAAASEARRVGIPIGGHLDFFGSTGISAIEASDSGVRIFDHLQTAGDLGARCLGPASTLEQCRAVAERFEKNGSWLVPTLGIVPAAFAGMAPFEVLGPGSGFPKLFGPGSKAVLEHFADFARQFWAGAALSPAPTRGLAGVAGAPPNDSAGLAVMRRAGVPILAGTDVCLETLAALPPGFALHTELALMVAEGLTPLEALQAATLNPARSLRGTDSLGTVAAGKLADLVVLDADPLEDIANTTAIRAVIANGRYLDRAVLDRLLADGRARVKPAPTAGAGKQQ